jgi:hypothetical protein
VNFDLMVSGILPVALLIFLGYVLKKSGFLPLSVWGPIEKFAVSVLYPGFLIPAIWHADFTGLAVGPISAGVFGSLFVAVALGFGLKPVLRLSGPTFTSVFQGLMRFNSFIFIPIVTAIYGPPVMKTAAVAISILIPMSNMVCILVLARWGEPDDGVTDRSLKALSTKLFSNIIFLSCLLGLLLNFIHAPSLIWVDKTFTMLGEAAIPTGLILAGVGLDFAYVAKKPWLVSSVSLFKVLIMPILSWSLCYLMGGDRLAQGIALACAGSPCAAAAYVQARQMGGDGPLLAAIIALTTTLSAITVPSLLWLFHLL